MSKETEWRLAVAVVDLMSTLERLIDRCTEPLGACVAGFIRRGYADAENIVRESRDVLARMTEIPKDKPKKGKKREQKKTA